MDLADAAVEIAKVSHDAPEWAVASILIGATAVALGAGIAGVVLHWQNRLGISATPRQVKTEVDQALREHINGDLRHIREDLTEVIAALKEVRAEVVGHGNRLTHLETLDDMSRSRRPWTGQDRRRQS